MRTRQTERGDRDKDAGRSRPVPSIRLDIANAQVWQDEQLLKLTPKALAVLHYLTEHPKRLIAKDELVRAVWRDIAVTDGALAACIRELRKVLQDEVQTPQYIETVHRRGYRWVAAGAAPVPSSQYQVPRSDTQDSALNTQHFVVAG